MSGGEVCLTPINAAEGILEMFWDPKLSGLDEWRVDKGEGCGVRIEQYWCWVGCEWTRPAAEGAVLRMRREFGVGCAQYDRLMVSLKIPETAGVRIVAETERGKRVYEGMGTRREHFLELSGAGVGQRVYLQFSGERLRASVLFAGQLRGRGGLHPGSGRGDVFRRGAGSGVAADRGERYRAD